jgi:hypothetical protein
VRSLQSPPGTAEDLPVSTHIESPGDCPCCGRPLDGRHRDTRFGWPDAVFELPERERTEGSWLNDEDPRKADFLMVPGVGSFVRALLPVPLTEGFSIRFGVWLEVDDDQWSRTYEDWWTPEYTQLRLPGRLANAIMPWGLLGAEVLAAPVDPEDLPVCTAVDPDLARVMSQESPYEPVFRAYFG